MKQDAKILIVDDNQINLTLLSGLLREFSTIEVDNGYDALEKVKTHHIDLVLLDVMMPDFDGFDVCKELKNNESTADIPVIFITARTDDESKLKGFKLGAVDYVTKPFNQAELLARAKTHIDLKNAKQQLENELQSRRKIENELRISEAKYRTLFSKADDGILLLDKDTLVDCNEKAVQMYGFAERKEMFGVSLLDLSPPGQPRLGNSQPAILDKLNLALQNVPQRFYWQHITRQGELFDAEINLNALQLDGKNYLQAIVRDVTEKLRSEKELENYRNHLEKLVKERTALLEDEIEERKNTEEELLITKEQLELSLMAGNIAWWIWDRKTGKITADSRRMEMLGYHSAEISPNFEAYTSLIHPEDYQATIAAIERHIQGGTPFYAADYRIKTKDGAWKWLHDRGKIIVEDPKTKKALKIAGVVLDITERKNAERELESYRNHLEKLVEERTAELKKSQAYLNAIIQNNKNSIHAFDSEGRFILFNESYRALFKMLYGDFPEKGMHVYSYMKNEQKAWWLNCMGRLHDGEHFFEERIIDQQDDKKRYYEIWFTPIIIDGEVIGGAEIIIEITDRKLSEIALKASEEKFRNIFNNSNDAISIRNLKGDYIEINSEYERLTAYSKEELKNNSKISNQIYPKDDKFENQLSQFSDREQYIAETEIRTKDNRIIPVEISARIISFNQREKALLSIIRDITERKEVQRKIFSTIIQTEEKERDRFAKDLHDGLGALLSSINIYLDMITQDELDDDEYDETLHYTQELVSEAINSAKEIANNLRPTILTEFGLVASISSFIEKLNKTGKINIRFIYNDFDYQLDSNTEIILFRIVNELINNTLKYANADVVTLKLNNKSNIIKLHYHDDGVGFDVEKVMQSDSKGMGLNNLTSRINSINGKCEIQSSPNEGMEVKIILKV